MTAALRQYIRTGLFLLGAAFIVWIFIDSRHAVADYLGRVNVPWLLLALAISLGYYALSAVVYYELLRKYGFNGGYRRIRDLYFYGQFAKHIPGKVWGMVYHAAALQMPSAGGVVLLANLDFFAAVILGVAGLSAGIIFWHASPVAAGAVYAAGLTAAAGVMRSECILVLTRKYCKARFSSSGGAPEAASRPAFVPAVLYLMAMTGVYFLMNAAFMYAVFGLTPAVAADYVAYLGVGWILGLILFIVPAGVGVREFVFVFMAQGLGQNVEMSMVGAMAVLLRFWQVVQDVAGAGLIFCVGSWEQRHKK